ncbi:adenylyltransferase/cytidyltransferase family protein [Carnobacterium mobile]|uniref:adenylyltransferase/cytidyltransferase family protein n=1 Tax=Carnobacterium mobile TaxID=2750 RepID=UPI00068B19A4|nr:adenylyltransferase/cytidyltransferase family protein [Carnobacterium mobile]
MDKVILCHGCFDIFHIGHLYHLLKAKEYGDYLIVSITGDQFINKGPNRPAYNQHEREQILSHIDIVDKVIVSNSVNAINSLKAVSPDYFVKGSDYKNSDNENFLMEKKFCEDNKIKVIFTDERTNSSTELYNKYFKI